MIQIVIGALVREGHILLVHRSPNRPVYPDMWGLGGGHMEPGESPEAALRRELLEELGLTPRSVAYVCTLLHRSEEFRKLHFQNHHQ